MKEIMRKFFFPILNHFESYEGSYSYKKSHRKILLVVGMLFFILSIVSLVSAIVTSQIFAAFPFVVFFCVSTVCFVVGWLGSDRAVAKIWGNK